MACAKDITRIDVVFNDYYNEDDIFRVIKFINQENAQFIFIIFNKILKHSVIFYTTEAMTVNLEPNTFYLKTFNHENCDININIM